ncbi:MAG: WhiB family transcriptional regulator [Actinomycetota bacterium]
MRTFAEPDVRALRERAACLDAPPEWFEATEYHHATQALALCAACPVVDLCDYVVAPAESYFDGVAAGRVWRNGADVAEVRRDPSPYATCGTEYGYEVHRLHGEKACVQCRLAKAEARRRRKDGQYVGRGRRAPVEGTPA